MKYLIIFLIQLFIVLSAQADIISQLQIEQPLQEKIQKIFRIYDPDAEVILQLSYKKFEDVLPGTNLSGEDFSLTDFRINTAQVIVFTEKNNTNETVESLVYKALNLSKNQVQISYQNKFYKSDKKSEVFDTTYLNKVFEEISTKLSTFTILSLIFCALVGLSALFIFQKIRSNQNRKLFQDLATSISNISLSTKNSGSNSNMNYNSNSRNQSATTARVPQDQNLKGIDLPDIGISEYLADCYWTEKDQWALGFWQQLNAIQKKYCLDTLPFMYDYAKYFVQKEADLNTSYLHPYYLNPIKLAYLPNSTILQLFEKNKSYWHMLSPLRQEALKIDLKTRLSLLNNEKNSLLTFPTPETLKTKRNLSSELGQIDLTEEDEVYVLENPQMIPANFRNSIRSLVWLKLLPTEAVLKILENFDAKSLALGLAGPESIVKELVMLLPDKKRALVQDYQLRQSPDKNSSAYEDICQLAAYEYSLLESKSESHAA